MSISYIEPPEKKRVSMITSFINEDACRAMIDALFMNDESIDIIELLEYGHQSYPMWGESRREWWLQGPFRCPLWMTNEQVGLLTWDDVDCGHEHREWAIALMLEVMFASRVWEMRDRTMWLNALKRHISGREAI